MTSIIINHINLSIIRAANRTMAWLYTPVADGAVYTPLHENDSKGHQWFYTPATIATTPEHYSLFQIAEDKAIYQANFDLNDTGDYTPWVKVGGTVEAAPGLAFENGVLHIFHVGVDSGLCHKTWTFKDSSYSPPEGHHKIAHGLNALISPAAVIIGASTVAVFVVSKYDMQLHRYIVTGHGRKWEKMDLPGKWKGGLKAVSLRDGEWNVFGINPEGQINHVYYRHEGGINIEAQDLDVLGIDAISSKDSKIELLATTSMHEVHHRTLHDGNWSNWETLPGRIINAPKAVAHKPGALAVFGIGDQGKGYGNVRNSGSGAWGGWFQLPQTEQIAELA